MSSRSDAKVVLGSRNAGKIAEIRALLEPRGIEVAPVSDFPGVADVVEDGETFAANAAKKASEIALKLKQWTIGEDSGLAVDALDGAPGVLSARYAGEPTDDDRNNQKLIHALDNVADDKRGASYICHVVVADPAGEICLSVEACCRGRITREPRGDNGFGYDPYFLIREYHQTFGELSPAVKRRLSHRARAFERIVPGLIALLHGTDE